MSVDAWEMAADCPSHRSLQGPTTPCCAGNLQKLWIALGNKEQLLSEQQVLKGDRVHALEEQLAQHDTGPSITLGLKDRERLFTLGRDLSRAWDSASASVETRKKIVRLLIAEIVIDVADDTLALVIHWQGGDHTRLNAKRNRVGQNRWVTDTDVVDLDRA
jgi:hypothetical protein